MNLIDETVESYFNALKKPDQKAYARAYWKFLQGNAAEPEKGELTDTEALAVRIKLAGIRLAE
jgi:hypothetical protein